MGNMSFRNYHLIFVCTIVIIFIFASFKLYMWNRGEKSGYNPNETTTEFDTEPLDYIQDISKEDRALRVDDGELTILCLGNSPFADNRNNGGLSEAIGERLGAKVYNASIGNSYVSMKQLQYSKDYPIDAFSLYQVANAINSNDYSVMEEGYSLTENKDARVAIDTLKSINLDKIDILAIMYDISDYIDLRPVMDPNKANKTNVTAYTGSLYASINLIQEKYPQMRIVFMSHTPSGFIMDGEYIDGDKVDRGNGTLIEYLLLGVNVCIENGVSFIDYYYGPINVDNRDKYISKNFHLNIEGVNVVANRFCELIGEHELIK